MIYSELKEENGKIIEVNKVEVDQSKLTADCWLIQIKGFAACKECEYRGTDECGGKRIIKAVIDSKDIFEQAVLKRMFRKKIERKTRISTKTKYVRTDGWRGYFQPVNAVCGANDTGMFPDSPCKSDTCEAELKMAIKILNKAKIKYLRHTCETSNCFCVHRYVLVHPDDRKKALELLADLPDKTTLLYLCE